MISMRARNILALLIALILAAVTALPTYADAFTITGKEFGEFEEVVTACNGEDIYLTGRIFMLFHTTFEPNTGYHTQSTWVYRDVSGEELSTGTQYELVGGSRQHFFYVFSEGFPLNATYTQALNLVSAGGTDNLQVRSVQQFVINADGSVVLDDFKFSSECVG